jgi:hypothetical protein
VMWEFNHAYESFGTTRTLENIPVFTDQPTMEGLLIESSLNAPFHFINQAEVSTVATHAVPGVDYPGFDMATGVEHLRLFGVRYFVAFTDKVKAAVEEAGLPVVGEVPVPVVAQAAKAAKDPENEDATETDGTFVIYEVGGGDLVEVPPYRPVATADPDWRDRSLEWYRDPTALQTPLAYVADPRATDAFVPEPAGEGEDPPAPGDLPREPLSDPGPVDGARWVGNERLEFTTDRVGEPHVVKVSWFPNWRAEGADGPWMLSPGLMVVVPTSSDVALVYRDTPLEVAGKAMTLAGLAVLAATGVIWVRRRRSAHEQPDTEDETPAEPPDETTEPQDATGEETGSMTAKGDSA